MAPLGHSLKGTGECVALGVAQDYGSEGSQCGEQAGMSWVSTGAPGLGGLSGSPWCWGLWPSLTPSDCSATTLGTHHPSPFQAFFLPSPSYHQEVPPKFWPQGRAWDVIFAHDFIPGDHRRGSLCLSGSCPSTRAPLSVPCGHFSPAASSANIHPRGTAFLSSSRSPA